MVNLTVRGRRVRSSDATFTHQRCAQPCGLAKEVAYPVGFNDLSYFTRAFKRQLGVCPSDYQAGARLS